MYPGKGNNNNLLPIVLFCISSACIIATIVLAFYGIYFFFLFVPISFGLLWSIKKLWRNRSRKQWNVEDLR
jgi:hypothetical protein